LTNPDYHKRELFNRVKEAGYDGIIINDWAQSKNFGNVGHISIGLFPSGIKKVEKVSIPASNYDWNNYDEMLSATTDEFKAWHKNEVRKAISHGLPVPEKVLQEYPDLIQTKTASNQGLSVSMVSADSSGDLVLQINGRVYRYRLPYNPVQLGYQVDYYNRKGWGKQLKKIIDYLKDFIVK
jgi:hypothetical protein